MTNAKPIPDNSSVLIPMLVCHDVSAEVDFCKTTFGALEVGRRPGPDGTVAHALLTISGEMIIIEAEWPTLASRAAAGWQLAGGDLRLRRRCRQSG
jgi:PhnB protein